MNYLVMDIETVPDRELWTPPEDDTEAFPPTYAHRVVCIGAVHMSIGSSISTDEIMIYHENEVDILAEFCERMNRRDVTIVTWNGRTFDIPVIVQRCLKHKVIVSWINRRGMRYRYSEEGHLDLMDQISDYGASRFLSLDAVCRLLGYAGKDTTGADVPSLFEQGKVKEICDYCMDDVRKTSTVLIDWLVGTGRISPIQALDML